MLPLWNTVVNDENEKKLFDTAYKEAKQFRKYLQKYLNNKLTSLELTSEADYDLTNWALKRADRDGQVRLIKTLQKLIEDLK